MLFAALGATIVGFVLLIVALVTANLWLAIACVAVSVIGVVLLLVDVLTYRRADRDETLAERLGEGDRDDAEHSDEAERSDDAKPTGDAEVSDEPERSDDPEPTDDAEAIREARTVGHEEFGHHQGSPALGGLTSDQWSHETPANTDTPDINSPEAQAPAQGALASGRYDRDMTDQIPTIEVERAWGAEWEPPEDPRTT